MHAQLSHDVFSLVVEEVIALGEGAAVGTQVGPNGSYRTIEVGDKRAFGSGIGEYVAGAGVGSEARLMEVEDVDARGIAGGNLQAIG